MVRPGEILGRVVAQAPVRVADVGGWTDTWFGSPGRVCYLAMGPAVQVDTALIGVDPDRGLAPVRVVARDLGVDHRIGPAEDGHWRTTVPTRHPLLEQAIGQLMEGVATLPRGLAMEVWITSSVPAGASLGTSASVVVAILGALDELVGDGFRTRYELAALAHRVETERVGREAGVQDHWAASLGGCGSLLVDPYPDARHEPIALAEAVVAELGDRLVTVVFGPHDSSAVHHEVIDAVTGCTGAEYDRVRRVLDSLCSLAIDAAWAIGNGDIDGWAAVLTESVAAQTRLHPGLVGPAHRAAIEVARRCGATGWKVNGAGGDGGSLTVVARPGGAPELRVALAAVDPSWVILDLWPSAGIQVREL